MISMLSLLIVPEVVCSSGSMASIKKDERLFDDA